MTVSAILAQSRRRLNWLTPRSMGAAANLALTALMFATHGRRSAKLPPMVKIDISPVCSLACPACLHADPRGRSRPLLERQTFGPAQRMELDAYHALISELRGTSLAVSLYYYGDPLAHPRFTDFVRIAAVAGLMTHASTHLSYNLSDEKIADIVSSGLSHITVDVDGATQETYEVTRVRGRLGWVLRNLQRLVAEKQRQGRELPHIEVQHLRFPHHAPGESAAVEALARETGADSFSTFQGAHFDVDGDLYNAVDTDQGARRPGAALSRGALPRCHWPYTGTVIKYDGDVIPCCKWREGQQYSTGGDVRAVGNVYRNSLEEIWNGDAYRAIRAEVSNPAANGHGGSFCEGCPKLYDTPSRLGSWQPG